MEGVGHQQRTNMAIETTYVHVVYVGILQISFAYHLAVHRYRALLRVEFQGSEVWRLDDSVVAYLAHVGALFAGPYARIWVELVAHLLSCQLTFVVSLVECNLQLHWVPFANLRVLPSDGDWRSACSGLGDGWRNALDGCLDRVLTAFCFVLSLLLLCFNTSSLACFVQQTAPLCLSRCAKCKHGHQRHTKKCSSTFHKHL